MAPHDKGNDKGVKVDTVALKTFGQFLIDRSGDLNAPIADVDAILVSPGDPTYIPAAATIKTTVETRKTALKTSLTKLRDGLDTMGQNMFKIADLYHNTEDKNKAEQDGLVPLIQDNGGIVPVSAPAPPPPPVIVKTQ